MRGGYTVDFSWPDLILPTLLSIEPPSPAAIGRPAHRFVRHPAHTGHEITDFEKAMSVRVNAVHEKFFRNLTSK